MYSFNLTDYLTLIRISSPCTLNQLLLIKDLLLRDSLFQILHRSDDFWYLSLYAWLISVSSISIHIVTNDRTSSYLINRSHCKHKPSLHIQSYAGWNRMTPHLMYFTQCWGNLGVHMTVPHANTGKISGQTWWHCVLCLDWRLLSS
jgi:hypothetical protein